MTGGLPNALTIAPTLVGDAPAIVTLRLDIELASRTSAKVLITGETGVGKDVVAQSIHQGSARRVKPFLKINCAGMPDTLLESEFFGHARGSFTGAFRDNPGLLRQANGGTLLLDEVGEMSLRMQGLLLRFLESGEVHSVGGTSLDLVDVRLIAATHRDLLARTRTGDFREDLYYRLNVLHLHAPPLREHPEDVPALLDHFGRALAHQEGRPAPQWSAAAIDALCAYEWPGNVRELRNIVERLVVRVQATTIDVADLPAPLHVRRPSPVPDAKPAARLSNTHDVQAFLLRLAQGESFWTTVYPAFMSRDLTRADLRCIVRTGLEEAHGSYRTLVHQFNMPADDYTRFLDFLKQYDCHTTLQGFRMASARLKTGRLANAGSA